MRTDIFIKTAPAYYQAGTALELIGGPGCGKSSVIYQVAAMMSKILGEPFGIVTQILSTLDPADMRGFLFPFKEEGEPVARFTRPSIFPSRWNVEVYIDGIKQHADWARENGIPEKGILFFDEFAQADHEVQKPMGQVMLERMIGEFRLPDGWVTWAASNRPSDKSGVTKRLMFLQNRVKQIPIEPLYEPWAAWANKIGLHPLAITFAKKFPSKVFQDRVPDVQGPFCTPRSLVLCTKDLEAMRDYSGGDYNVMQLPEDEVAMETIAGWIGEGAAVDFISHIRLANELPEIEDIAEKPAKTPIPEKVDARFVLASMLAHHADKKTAKPFLDYMKRMDKEMQVLFVSALTQRAPQIVVAPGYSDWISNNQDLLLAANQG